MAYYCNLLFSPDLMARKGVMQVKFQRDINRFTDNDRGSRKRGLQRILDELPWSTSDPHESTELETLITSCLLPLLPPLFSDPVEKCRELSLHILSKTCDSLSSQHSISLLQAMGPLCLRLSDTPFPESTEELRLQIIVLLSKICARMSSSGLDLDASLLKSLLQTITLSLTDTFPAVKQESAQLLVSILPSVAPLIRMNSKLLVRNLVANVYHQHSKVRVDTLKALGGCLSVLEEDYSSVVRDQLHPLLLRLLTDHSAQVRLALVYVCETVLLAHINASAVEETTTNIDLTVTLLILMSDEAKEVSQRAELALATITSLWSRSDEGPQQRLPHEGEDIVDAEVELRRRLEDLSAPPMDIIPPLNTRISESPKGYLSRHVQQLITTLLEGVGGWTSGSRLLFLRGLERSCALLESEVTLVLHRLLPPLGSCLLEDDLPSRSAAEAVCHTLGRHISCSTTSNEVLPYIEGSIAGLDTALSRASGLRLAQHILEGHILRLDTGEEEPEIGEDLNCLIGNISHLLTHPALHEFREPVLRESCLLLTRSIRLLITEKRSILFQDDYQSDGIEFCVVTALVYLRGRVAGESYENIISEVQKMN